MSYDPKEAEIRMQCLRLAARHDEVPADEVISTALAWSNFVMSARSKMEMEGEGKGKDGEPLPYFTIGDVRIVPLSAPRHGDFGSLPEDDGA